MDDYLRFIVAQYAQRMHTPHTIPAVPENLLAPQFRTPGGPNDAAADAKDAKRGDAKEMPSPAAVAPAPPAAAAVPATAPIDARWRVDTIRGPVSLGRASVAHCIMPRGRIFAVDGTDTRAVYDVFREILDVCRARGPPVHVQQGIPGFARN